ncbi:hypothetical protein V1264_002251 [Littorina saxatilis]|uniref:C2H2-type domain-containing protein n=1 Tax=Littorina saxatilis TaxID=31220 RepID=A0AAN9C484_9CAEN
MDNMATGFAFGMGGDDFGNMDFQTSMAGDGEGAPPPSLMPGMGQFPPFNPAMSRDAMFSQASMMPHRGGGMDLPRFSGGGYSGGGGSAGSFNPMMSSRHPFTPGGMSGFMDMFPQQMPSSDGGGERMSGVMDGMSDNMPGYSAVMSSPASSSPSVMPSSMPVFPNTPSNLMHSAIGGGQDVKHNEGADRMKATNSGIMEQKSSQHSPGRSGYKSPIQSPPPPMQTCFPGQMPHPPSMQQHQQQQQQHGGPGSMTQLSHRNLSSGPSYKEEKDFSGGPSDPMPPMMIGSEVTPMQRRRQPQRRATMLAQEAAAAAAHALAIETKQVPMPPMLSARESHILGAIPHGMGFPHSMPGQMPMFASTPQQSMQAGFPHSHTSPRRRGRPRTISNENHTLIQQSHFAQPRPDPGSGFPLKQTVVPFFKAGRISLREPEVFECLTRNTPLVTQGTQTGQDGREEELVSADKPYLPADPKYANVNPKDGKGGFPTHNSSPRMLPFHPMPIKRTDDHYKGFIEGEGYAKRGNSKTVVSPSFGEAAARAVMTTCVGDNATVVTVAIMSRQNSGVKTRLVNSTHSPRASTSHDPCDDLKENVLKTPPADNLDSSNTDDPSSGVQTRRSRRASVAMTPQPTTSSRGRTLRKRTNPDNISIEDDANFEIMMEERKEKVRAAEQERMEVRLLDCKMEKVRAAEQERMEVRLLDCKMEKVRAAEQERMEVRLLDCKMEKVRAAEQERMEVRLLDCKMEKVRAAEQERMEISIRIDDSQCITYGEQKRWQCELCDKSYTTKHNLVMHMLDHNGIKPHLCLVCGKYFKQLSHLNTHMLTHDKVRPHVCDTCGKGFTQISHLKRHLTVHQETKPYCCDECGRGFTFPSELRIHKERHISGRIFTDHCCAECGEEFTSAALLKQHELIHENQNDLNCMYCNRSFRYPSQLRDHIVIHSSSRPYMCTECGMDFMKEHHLRSHQFTHTGLRPYSCPICSRAFNQRANMMRHMLIHKAERSYKCDYCDKTFTQPQTLKAHMVVHADHKPYRCNLCGKEFGRLHNLHGHMHMHNNSKPYVCFCGSSFTLKGNLNRHKKVKHGLNESTESMEEDAVHFLSSWGERAREERSGDDTMDGYDMNGTDGNCDGHMDGNDIDGSSMDLMDRSSSRKQRKSTPRKIPRRFSGARKKGEDGVGEDEQEDDDEAEDEMDEEESMMRSDQYPPIQFQALNDNANTYEESRMKRPTTEDYSHELEGEETKADVDTDPKRSRRGRTAIAENGDFVAGMSDSEKDDGEREELVGDDSEWLPGEGPPKNGKGAKLDSLIAEKFKNSEQQ